FNTRVSLNSPPVALPGDPVPLQCLGSGQFSCVQVVITTRIGQFFTNVLGIPFAYVTVAAAAQAVLPTSSVELPPPHAFLLYQPQSACDTDDHQCFDETKPVARTGLSCAAPSN